MDNKQYSILFVALYCYTGHVKTVIEQLRRQNPLADITLLSNIKPDVIRKEIPDSSIMVEWYDVKDVTFIGNKRLRGWVIRYRQNRFFSRFAKKRRFDIVNIHFPKRHLAYAYKYLREMSRFLVITPWGSDILRQNQATLNQLSRLYQRADYIVTALETPLGRRIQNEFNIKSEKFVGNFFGSSVIEYAEKLGDTVSQEEAKERFGLSGRYVISCGYNRKVPQRHKVIIEAINQVKDRLPQNFTLVFPMTYANPRTDYDYVQELQQLCAEKQLPALFVTDFLSVEDVFKLRKLTDMFVHIQTTDASSGSVMEYILLEKKIVHGSWIKYEELEKYSPLFYFPVDRIEDLGKVIVDAYKSDPIAIPQEVLDYIKSFSMSRQAKRMNDFYMSLV